MHFISSLCARAQIRIVALCVATYLPHVTSRAAEVGMADIAYLALGLGLMALMGAYAYWAARA